LHTKSEQKIIGIFKNPLKTGFSKSNILLQ